MIAFLLVIGVSFYAVATSLITLVGDSLLDEKVQVEKNTVSDLAIRFSEALIDQTSDALYEDLLEAGRQSGGRILLLDMDSKVQFDTFSEYNGMRLDLGEVSSILSGENTIDYGFHKLETDEYASEPTLVNALLGQDPSGVWVGYFTAVLVRDGTRLGVLLYSSQVQDMIDSLLSIRVDMMMYFLLATIIVIIFSFIVSGWITRPVGALTAGIERMAKGDYTGRVHVSGGGEMGKLAETFNAMSEKLENLERSRNQFVSNASHELKTPLATMKILLESLIYQEDMDVKLRNEFMDDINKEIDRLNSVTGDLLTLVHIDSNKLKLRREMIRLADSVKETVRRLRPLASGRGQVIELSIQDDCDIFADPIKIQQVIYNIIENGIKYSADGGTVKVSLARDGRDAVLKITDNGVGIPKEDIPHIFDRFYRVDKARSRETGGTGLGLSIVQQIVRLHGGSISVQSQIDKGTTFTIELPLK